MRMILLPLLGLAALAVGGLAKDIAGTPRE